MLDTAKTNPLENHETKLGGRGYPRKRGRPCREGRPKSSVYFFKSVYKGRPKSWIPNYPHEYTASVVEYIRYINRDVQLIFNYLQEAEWCLTREMEIRNPESAEYAFAGGKLYAIQNMLYFMEANSEKRKERDPVTPTYPDLGEQTVPRTQQELVQLLLEGPQVQQEST